jgi:hypothetical protein
MSIPELMYGSWRFDTHTHAGNDRPGARAEYTDWAELGTAFASIRFRDSAWSVVGSFLAIIFWPMSSVWAIGTLVAIGLLLARFIRKLTYLTARKRRETYPETGHFTV